MPVIAAFEFDDFIPAREASGEPDAAHGRLCAAVDHAHLLHGGHEIADRSSHFHFEGIGNSEAEAAGGGATDGCNHGVIGMPKDGRPPCPHVVDEFPSFDGEDARPIGSFDEKWFSAYGAKSANGRVHAAGDYAFSALEQDI